MKIGILSDTHGLLRPEVTAALGGCGCILHAGDVGGLSVIAGLEAVAPVRAVRGNNEREGTEALPSFLDCEIGGLRVYVTHKKKDLPADLSAYDLAVVGHSHQYAEAWMESGPAGKRTLLLNPGSCGPRRFHQPITLAVVRLEGGGIRVERIHVPPAPKETAPKIDPKNVKLQIETVMRETQKGRGIEQIAGKYGLDRALVEQIVRLYVTHPGVTADGIMTKMGI